MSIRTEVMPNYVFFTFCVTLTLTFDLELPKTIRLLPDTFMINWGSRMEHEMEFEVDTTITS